jgi:superfamily II RNA helicase
MFQDILNEIKYSKNKIDEFGKELIVQKSFIKNEEECKSYIDSKNKLNTVTNKLRRETLNLIYKFESEILDIKQQSETYNSLLELKEQIKNEENNLVYAQTYIDSQVANINTILCNNGFINETSMLTNKGLSACYINEIHSLVMCDIFEKFNEFKEYTYIDIFCILSCLYDIKITDDYKDFTPTFLVNELKYVEERIHYYYDEEMKYQLCYNEQVIQYDIMNYIKIWMEECDNPTSSIHLIEKIKSEKGLFTGDFIKCCLKKFLKKIKSHF